MKLYNKTSIPDAILSALLIKAGRSVGAATSNVVVDVGRGLNMWSSGEAHECCATWRNGRYVDTDGGWFKIILPLGGTTRPDYDPLEVAQSFLRVARHEWGHIRDFQHGGRRVMEFARAGRSGRRAAHDSRPEEIRANDYVWDSDQRLSISHFDDVLLALALAIEEAAAGTNRGAK